MRSEVKVLRDDDDVNGGKCRKSGRKLNHCINSAEHCITEKFSIQSAFGTELHLHFNCASGFSLFI